MHVQLLVLESSDARVTPLATCHVVYIRIISTSELYRSARARQMFISKYWHRQDSGCHHSVDVVPSPEGLAK